MKPREHDKNEPTDRKPINPLVIIGATVRSLPGSYPCALRRHGFANAWRGIHGGSPL